MRSESVSNRPVALALTISLAVSGVFGLGVSALATTPEAPTISFDGNSLSSSLPAPETANRTPGTLALSTDSLSRTASTNRAGYTFGGWSLTLGGAATTTITTTTTSDTARTLYAVWNTPISYNLNGADSGLPTGGVTQGTYRFGQTLTLPTSGTMVKSGFAFGGWMETTSTTVRSTTYLAAPSATGNPTLYAAWIKTVTFNANGATAGTIPAAQVYILDGTRLKLPVISEMTLRKTGYEFVGWSTSATGKIVNNPTSYLPVVASRTLFAIWRIQSTKLFSKVFFSPGKSILRAGQKLALRDLVDSLDGRTEISIKIDARRHSSTAKKLGKKRNTAVVQYLRSLGVEATFIRTNKVGPAGTALMKKNNRVNIQAGWTNPAS